ncbi:hypothetical protein AU156_gp106 [Edwardsiella phage PEi20]|uniref:Uncharacterized protein n=1 Tax=Edwardsiella phage PEi20 TaxID=1608310 RepID=A0A0B6VTN6_9CAUD|nr:hypothetical protein AU156_gp106 [Edwardsiella phage PEi20]BAQ22756.1 conserved hypothetical protein [Edwardsiella phage PEi20]
MLYDPYGDSEDGVIIVKTEVGDLSDGKLDLEIAEWHTVKNGIIMHQGDDTIALDAEQVEALYQIIKHNR